MNTYKKQYYRCSEISFDNIIDGTNETLPYFRGTIKCYPTSNFTKYDLEQLDTTEKDLILNDD